MNTGFRFITELFIDIFIGISIAYSTTYTIYLTFGEIKWVFAGFIVLSIGLPPLLMFLSIGKKIAIKLFQDKRN